MPFEVKTLEVRDEATHIPVLAVFIFATPHDRQFRRAGYGIGMGYVLLTNLLSKETMDDPHDWKNQRTLGSAHEWILDHWAEIAHEDVIDVQWIFGETDTIKVSEHES